MRRTRTIILLIAAGLAAVSCKSKVQQPKVADYEMSYAVGGVTFEMVRVPSGFYSMGLSSDNRRQVTGGIPQEVAVDGFVISSKPVSQALWTAVMGKNPSVVKDPDAPVDMVSWQDALKFIARLNKATGKVFSLPTEAQWEKAAKHRKDKDFTVVAEWCADTYDAVPEGQTRDDYFNPMTVLVNPAGPPENSWKLVRTTLERMKVESHTRRVKVGFRIAQPTEDILSEDVLNIIQGTEFNREKIDASDASPETLVVGDVSFKMIKVQGGEFIMGFNLSDSPYPNFTVPENEKISHQVSLDDFAIGETEVTVGLWNAVMGSVPYLNKVEEKDKPVGNVSWYDCQNFLLKLNALTGRTFRLPTEAEWEYAARGGRKSRHYGFSGSNDMYSAMWFLDNADMKAQDVKKLKANELGLYDMSGNHWEWCYDRAGDYSREALVNPAGAMEGGTRILRGGSCASRWDACRISNRSYMPAKNVKGTFGLRLAL